MSLASYFGGFIYSQLELGYRLKIPGDDLNTEQRIYGVLEICGFAALYAGAEIIGIKGEFIGFPVLIDGLSRTMFGHGLIAAIKNPRESLWLFKFVIIFWTDETF